MRFHKPSGGLPSDAGTRTRDLDAASPEEAHWSRWWDAVIVALLACTCVVVLGVPVFPSQDGPVHLYYVDILRSLLAHSGPYAQHFQIKSYFTPYALEYYSLLALETAFSAELSERLLICCYVFAFGLGFRYLVTGVAGRRNPWTLAGVPFCVNALVYKGFLNYSLGVALALFLCGLWIRCREHLDPRRVWALLGGFFLLLLTHPVPAAVFLLFAGLHWLADLIVAAGGSKPWRSSIRARLPWMALLAAMAVASALWVGRFTQPAHQAPRAAGAVFQYGWLRTVAGRLALWPVVPFTSLSYRIGPLILVAVALLALLWSLWKHGGRASAGVWALTAAGAICFALVCMAPESVNGSHYFPDRFAIYWPLFLFAAAAASDPPRRWSVAAGALAACVTCVVLPIQYARASGIVAELRPVVEAPAVPAGTSGLIISGPAPHDTDLAFEPFLWSGAHFFRRSGAILANTPWLDLPILMLRPAHPNRWSYMEPAAADAVLTGALSSPQAMPELGFVVRDGRRATRSEPLLSPPQWSPLLGADTVGQIYARRP